MLSWYKLKAEHISTMLQSVALWGKLNLSECRPILQNELEPSVFFPAIPPPLLYFLFIVLSVLCRPSSFFLTLSFWLLSLSLSHTQVVSCHQYGWQNISPSALPKQNEHLKQVTALGVICSWIFMPLSPTCQVSHVLNVAYGVTNLFPDQMVYKTLQILDLPETDITSYLEECSSFIDQAREQVHTNTQTHN